MWDGMRWASMPAQPLVLLSGPGTPDPGASRASAHPPFPDWKRDTELDSSSHSLERCCHRQARGRCLFSTSIPFVTTLDSHPTSLLVDVRLHCRKEVLSLVSVCAC